MEQAREKSARRVSGGVVGWLLPALLSGVLGVLTRTWRFRFVDSEHLFTRLDRGERAIVAFWHDRLFMMPTAARGRRICILVSEHRDGELATRALTRWGIHTVRGSATRGGARGLLRLVRAFREGYSLAVLPDGPRGPEHVAKPGVVHLARAVGAPIFPVTAAARPAARLKSWDRLIVPLPLARVELRCGEPIVVPRDARRDQLDSCRQALESRLNELTRAAELHIAG